MNSQPPFKFNGKSMIRGAGSINGIGKERSKNV